MYAEHARTPLMHVDYGGDAYAGMGIKAMKSFARPRGTEPTQPSPFFARRRRYTFCPMLGGTVSNFARYRPRRALSAR